MTKIGYARVSSFEQSLENQLATLKAEGCTEIYFEKTSGKRQDRPEFQKCIANLQEGDTLVITKIDRFARNTSHAIEVIQTLFQRGVKVHVLNLGMIDNTPTGKLIFSVFSAFAEFEREMIRERTAEGKAAAKLRPDFREGRPRQYKRDQILHAISLLNSHTYREVERMTGISRSTLSRAVAEKRMLDEINQTLATKTTINDQTN